MIFFILSIASVSSTPDACSADCFRPILNDLDDHFNTEKDLLDSINQKIDQFIASTSASFDQVNQKLDDLKTAVSSSGSTVSDHTGQLDEILVAIKAVAELINQEDAVIEEEEEQDENQGGLLGF